MKSITKQVTVTVEYDYVIFNGENYDEVKEFVKKYKLYGNSNINDSFHIRPADIPNLNESELLEWWKSTGEEVIESKGFRERRYNTHNYNNMPLWRKDELLMIEFKDKTAGYVSREWLCKDCAIIYANKDYHTMYDSSETRIEEFVNNFFEED